jgi:RIO kinase 1
MGQNRVRHLGEIVGGRGGGPIPGAAPRPRGLLEYLGDEHEAAPRLVNTKPSPAQGRELCGQFADLVRLFGRVGVVHADLSPFNLLVWQDRLYAIDFPQAVDPYTNPDGLSLLHHDVITVCDWFQRRGIECDAEALYADVLAETLQ